MSLKTLLSLKFVFSIAGAGVLLYFIYNVTGTYETVEEQNAVLFSQKEIYNQIIALGPDAVTEKDNLQKSLAHLDKRLQPQQEPGLGISAWLYIILISFSVFRYVLDYLDKKIDIAKLATQDTGEML